ncbi:peptidase M16 [Lottiidibacillus patelloidae]|uniref:Peptidase M16 n=1 Tax=Lottiidibacillus patelloidae TaxID=2670334 RepID=A0A263BYH9_9BACI|nr:pitrilysin family protein [Lottiidibacillus patelloidae]OZM58632.1 peptidase M16 [Lottiidibacillus patelloidae]
MSAVVHNKVELHGITLHAIETPKYKTNTIVLKCKAPLSEETVTARALIPHVLQSGTKNHPSREKLRSALEELYGATFTVDLSKKGDNHIITFRMDVANEKFLSDQTPLLEKALQLFSDIILQPLVENNAFKESIVEEEKRALKQRIQAIYNDKMRYANMRLIQEMCKEEPYRLNVQGTIEKADSLSANQLYQTYENMLRADCIDLFIVGDIELNKVQQITSKYFKIPEKQKVREDNVVKHIVPNKENVVFEEQEINQGKLHIGYRTNVTFKDEDYYPLQVFNGIYGGFSHSKLFINVREKASLAYYAASRVESHKGLLLVIAGIEFSNYDQALSIIKEQMQAMKSGNFSEEELLQTKSVIRNQILETLDNARGVVEILYHNVIANTDLSIDDMLSGIEKVTKEEVIEVANKIQLDTVYFLRGEGKE